MTTTIIFIRHGLTDWNAEKRWQGHLDIPLNDEEVNQAQALARRLRHWPIQTLYSSDLQRAAQTAAILGDAIGLIPIFKPEWRERNVGDFQGLTHETIKVQYLTHYHNLIKGIVSPPKGEDNNDLFIRARAALKDLLSQHEDDMVAVVSHGAILHMTLLFVLGLPLEEYRRVSLSGNTGISIVEAKNGSLRLTRLNDTSHLELIS